MTSSHHRILHYPVNIQHPISTQRIRKKQIITIKIIQLIISEIFIRIQIDLLYIKSHYLFRLPIGTIRVYFLKCRININKAFRIKARIINIMKTITYRILFYASVKRYAIKAGNHFPVFSKIFLFNRI